MRRLTLSLSLAVFLAASCGWAAERLPPKDVAAQVASGKVVLIDIRTPEEWAQTGIAASALPLDMTAATFLTELQAVIAANPGKRLAFICRSSNRSAQLTSILEAKAGLKDLIDVAGGMLGKGSEAGWIAAGLPVRQP